MEPRPRWHNGYSYLAYNFTDNVTCSETWAEGSVALARDLVTVCTIDDEVAKALGEPPTMYGNTRYEFLTKEPQENQPIGYLIEDYHGRTISFWLMKVLCDTEH